MRPHEDLKSATECGGCIDIAAAAAGETRATAETGGQKGRKPIRYDLIPQDFAVALNDYQDNGGIAFEMEQSREINSVEFIRGAISAFWLDGDVDGLLQAATVIEFSLGGWTATKRYLARVYGQGALKYSDNNWRKGYPWSWSYAALNRHVEAVEEGEFMDPEFGQPHFANAWWHCATLWTYATQGLGTDDRPKKEAA